MEKIEKKKYYLFIVLICILISAPLFAKGFFKTHDGNFHLNRIMGTIESIKDGQLLTKIIPNFVNGFGYGSNIFYPPISCYLPIILSILTLGNILKSFKLMILISIIMSAINMFNFILDVTKSKKAAILVCLIYITVPYRLIDIYVRMAIGEILAFAFIPLVFHGLYNIIYCEGKKSYLLIIGAAGILLSHTISTLLIIITALIYILLNMEKIIKNKKIVNTLIISCIIIIGLVAFFYLPLFEAMMSSEYYVEYYDNKINLAAHSSYLYELLMGKMNNNYLFTIFSENKLNSEICLTIGLPILIALIFTPFIFKKIRNEFKSLYISTLIIGCISAIATTTIFPWEFFQDTILGYIQFPMRMFIITCPTLSIIAGINIYLLLDDKKRLQDILILILIIVIYIQPIINLVNFDINYNNDYASEIEDISTLNTMNSKNCSEFEYLPINAKENFFSYIKSRDNNAVLLSGEASIQEQVKDGTTFTAIINNAMQDSVIELPYIYYKGYVCKLNNDYIEVVESENGMVCINIPKGFEGKITVKYRGTILSYVSLSISILTLILCIIYYLHINGKLNFYKNKKRS